MELWLCGRVKSGDFPNFVWDVQGVFTGEVLAVAACRDASYFVMPLNADEVLPHETTAAPNSYFPHSKQGDA